MGSIEEFRAVARAAVNTAPEVVEAFFRLSVSRSTFEREEWGCLAGIMTNCKIRHGKIVRLQPFGNTAHGHVARRAGMNRGKKQAHPTAVE